MIILNTRILAQSEEIKSLISKSHLPASEKSCLRKLMSNPTKYTPKNIEQDLRTYIDWYTTLVVERSAKIPSLRIMRNNLLDDDIEKIVALYGNEHTYPSHILGTSKKGYYLNGGPEVLRIYYADPIHHLFGRLRGMTEATVSKEINNPYFMAYAKDIPGIPADFSERVIPIRDLYHPMESNPALKEQINQAKLENPLWVNNLIEINHDNCGIALRKNTDGEIRAYVVAFDLQGDFWFQPQDDERIHNLLAHAPMPQGIDLNYFDNCMSQLNVLFNNLK